MIIFREKLFNCPIHSMTDFINDRDEKYFENVSLNFIKTLEMWDMDNSKYVFHWLCDMIIKKTILHVHRGYSEFTPQMAFIGVESNSRERAKILGINNNNIYEEYYEDSENFCKVILDRMLTEPHRGTNEPKYDSWFKIHPILNKNKRAKEYEKALKYVSLCMSGQLDPEVDGFEESTRLIYTTKVDYHRINSWSYDYQCLADKLIKCIKNILKKKEYPDALKNNYRSTFNDLLEE